MDQMSVFYGRTASRDLELASGGPTTTRRHAGATADSVLATIVAADPSTALRKFRSRV
jgi:hypothetical protein